MKRSRWTVLLLLTGAHALSAAAALAVAPLAPVLLETLGTYRWPSSFRASRPSSIAADPPGHPLDSWARVA